MCETLRLNGDLVEIPSKQGHTWYKTNSEISLYCSLKKDPGRNTDILGVKLIVKYPFIAVKKRS